MLKNKIHNAEVLIPWFINGSLDEAETNMMNYAISESAELSDFVEKDIRLAEVNNRGSKQLDELIAMRSEGFANLSAKIKSDKKQVAHKKNIFPLIKNSYHFSIAASVLIAVVAVGLYPLFDSKFSEKEYQTLTTASNVQEGIVLQIIFEPETSEKEIRSLLLESNGQLLSGPSRSGVYRLELSEVVDDSEVLSRLKTQSIVRWVEIEAQ